jgi:outer membrane protein assembly factor BamA
MTHFQGRPGTLALCAAVLLALPAHAQDGAEIGTRAELLATLRAQKARELAPYEPTKIEKALLYIEEHRILERLSTADGWYPRIGGLTTGGGFAGGAGYRKHFFGDQLFVDASAAISTKAYKSIDLHVGYPNLLGGHLEIGTNVRWRDFPQEDFFGIGNNSRLDMRSNFGLKGYDVNGRVALKPLSWLRFGGELGLMSPEIRPGTDPLYPPTQDLFTDVGAPGLDAQPDFVYQNLFVEVDYRDQPGNARSGGLWRAQFGMWNDRDLNQYDFGRFDGEIAHFFPIFDKKRVFALRVGVSYVNNEPGNRVPFYFLPYIGGSDTVRGFREFRFRDENAIFMNAEYRWEAFAGLDMALFFDMGEVRDDWELIDFNDAKTSYGLGFRFNTFKSVFLRLDIGAGGREGTRLFFKFGPAF